MRYSFVQKSIDNKTYVFVVELESIFVLAAKTPHVLKISCSDRQRIVYVSTAEHHLFLLRFIWFDSIDRGPQFWSCLVVTFFGRAFWRIFWRQIAYIQWIGGAFRFGSFRFHNNVFLQCRLCLILRCCNVCRRRGWGMTRSSAGKYLNQN